MHQLRSRIDLHAEIPNALRSRRGANWIIVLGLSIALWIPLLYAPATITQLKLASPGEIGDAFEHQFPFRAAWRWQYNAARYRLLRALPVQILSGQNGWLFYRAESVDDGHVFDDFRGEVTPGDDLVKLWCDSLTARRRWLSARGIAPVVIVIPNKETVYPDKLPDQLILKRGRTRLDAVVETCGDEFIDLRPALAEARRARDVYYPLGTHWNSYGAYVGYRAILGRLGLEPMPITAFREVMRTSDDSWLVQLAGTSPEPSPEFDPLDRHPACYQADGECHPVLFPGGPAGLPTDLRGFAVKNPELTGPVAVVFHDSFALWLGPWLAQHFRKTIFVTGVYQAAIVEQYRPDVVIIEAVERYMLPRIILPPIYPPAEVIAKFDLPDPTPLTPAKYKFGDGYEIIETKFERVGGQLIQDITLRRLGPPIPNETLFYHLMDENGKIIGQLDRAICTGCADPAEVKSWIERFTIPLDLVSRVRRIGIGIYGPPSPPLPVLGGNVDWDGHRAIEQLP